MTTTRASLGLFSASSDSRWSATQGALRAFASRLSPTRAASAFSLAACALSLAVTGCSSPCDQFYDAYEECGFADPGENVDALRDQCNQTIDNTEACSAGYDALVECIDGLDDACGYPSSCGDDLYYVYAACP